MLSFKIKEEISKILKSFEEAKYFFDCLTKINSTFPELEEYIQGIAQGSDPTGQANKLRNHLTNIRSKIGDVKPRSFFSSIEKLQQEINKAQDYEFNDQSQLKIIHTKLDDFCHAYESYVGSYNAQVSAALVVEAKSLYSLLDGFKNGLSFYLDNIESTFPNLENGSELSIVLSSKMTLSEFILKLQSVEKIYNELCMLANVSTSDFPVEILKIESGSLWAKIFGESKVIVLMTNMLESGVSFVYRNYTDEGKLAAIPKKVESIESIIQLSAKLKEQGIAVDEIQDHIKKSSVLLSKELNKLISDQPEIIINNNKLSIGCEIRQKLIQSNAPLKLEYESESE